MGMELFSHNQQAYEDIISMLAGTGKAAVIHRTGTGKSFNAFNYVGNTRKRRSAGSHLRNIFLGRRGRICLLPEERSLEISVFSPCQTYADRSGRNW